MSQVIFDSVVREYLLGGEKWVLGPLNIQVPLESSVCIVGPSGSGKSTLLHLLGALDSLTSGKIEVEGENISAYTEEQKNQYRKKTVGIIFQDFHLFKECTVFENVEAGLEISDSFLDNAQRYMRVMEILNQVGLKDKKNHFPSQLSGGQRQRVAIARAIVSNPKILLADEPTGNLDSKTGEKILDLIFSLAKKNNMGVWCVTHDENITKRCERVIEVRDGKVVS